MEEISDFAFIGPSESSQDLLADSHVCLCQIDTTSWTRETFERTGKSPPSRGTRFACKFFIIAHLLISEIGSFECRHLMH